MSNVVVAVVESSLQVHAAAVRAAPRRLLPLAGRVEAGMVACRVPVRIHACMVTHGACYCSCCCIVDVVTIPNPCMVQTSAAAVRELKERWTLSPSCMPIMKKHQKV